MPSAFQFVYIQKRIVGRQNPYLVVIPCNLDKLKLSLIF